MQKIQQLISGILHPLTLPLFGAILLLEIGIFGELPRSYKWYLEAIILFNMSIIPGVGILLMKKSGLISDLDVSKRSERIWPYFIVLVTGIAACIMLYRAQLPWWAVKLFLGSVLATFLAFFITLKWKISAHTLAFGCLIGAALIVSFQIAQYSMVLISVLLLLAGIQASSRLYLKAHTLGQVTGGFFLGLGTELLVFFLVP